MTTRTKRDYASDLLYFGENKEEYEKVKEILVSHYGERVDISDASDFVHGYRLQIIVEDETEDDYFRFGLKREVGAFVRHGLSLPFAYIRDRERIEAILEEVLPD